MRRSPFLSRALRAAACLLLLLVPRAGAGEKSATVADVDVTIGSAWPSSLARGWQPLAVRAENRSGDPRRVDFVFTCANGPETDRVRRTVVLAPGETARFELAAPVRATFQNGYDVQITTGGDRSWISDVGSEESGEGGFRRVLLVSRDGTRIADAAAWTTALSDEARAPYEAAGGGPTNPMVLLHGGPAAAPAAVNPVVVAGVAHAELSRLPEAYSSLDAVVLDTRGGLPDADQLAPILAWARTGGFVAVWGPGARDLVARTPALAAWAEPRFQAKDAEDRYVFGLGLLAVVEDGASPPEPAQRAALVRPIEALAPWGSAGGNALEGFLSLPGVDVPYRPLALLLVFFALIVGPANMIVVRRLRRPALLLVTIPAISLLFSAGLFAYGALAQGLDVRASSHSRAVLDLRTHHGSCLEARETFAGLAAGPGLRPGPGTTVLRPVREGYDWSNQREYAVELDDGVLLADGWLPVRTPTRHAILVDRAARARVEVARGADGWTLTNGLETPILRAIWRDAAGELVEFRGPIAPGRTAAAEAASPDGDAVRAWQTSSALSVPVEDGGFLPRGCWLARVERAPVSDTCGIEYDEVSSSHVVLGVTALEEGR